VPEWLAKMSGPGRIEGLSVAVSEKCDYVEDSTAPPVIPAGEARRYACKAARNMVAVGGFFTAASDVDIEFFDQDDGQLWQPSPQYEAETNGGEDALVVLYGEGDPWDSCQGCYGGELLYRLTFGGDGDDRANALAFDPVDQSIIVTGFFSDAVDFNPEGSAHVKTSEGGKDIFVARYLLDTTIFPGNPAPGAYVLDWVYAYGTETDDEGLGVALDADGNVYAVGYHTPSGSLTGRDIFVARIDRVQASMDAVTNWDFNHHEQPGDQVARDVAVDGLDRVLVTGRFGCPHANTCVHLGSQFDFNPSAGTDIRSSNGGGDIFVARYFPDAGAYNGVFTFGGDKHDEGVGVAVDPVYTQTVAHAGFFGAPNAASSGYTVDLDPEASVSSTVESTGGQDGFASLLRQEWFTEDLKNMVAIVLDSTWFVDETPAPTGDDEFAIMRETYAHLLDGTLKIPAGVLSAPHDGTVAVAVFMHGLQDVYINSSPPAAESRATQVIPWTAFNNGGQARLFSDRLLRLPRWLGQGPHLDEALEVAEASVANWQPVNEACFRTIHLVTVMPNDQDPQDLSGDMAAARAAVVGSSVIERIDAFGVRINDFFEIGPSSPQTAQEYLWNYTVDSDDGVEVAAETGSIISGKWPGFEDPNFADFISRLLKRVAYCPGDFNLDGVVDADDYLDFLDAHGSASHPDYVRADWNFDGFWDQTDIDLFEAAWELECCP
jgi:hypothetical protein